MAYYATYMPNELGEQQKVVINAGVGFVLPYYGETAPPGTLACDGSEISRATYDELFAVLGTKAGAGDGSTTFNLPDLRGDFIRGLGGDNAGELGAKQGDTIRNIYAKAQIRPLNSSVAIWGGLYGAILYSVGTGGDVASTIIESATVAKDTDSWIFDASRVVPTAAENRPVNVALLWCIIYE